MTNLSTLKDVLIDLYYSGDLVPVWDEDDKGRFVADLIMSDSNDLDAWTMNCIEVSQGPMSTAWSDAKAHITELERSR